MLLASLLATDTNNLPVRNQTSPYLVPRFLLNRRVYSEVSLNLPFSESPSSRPAPFLAETAVWIEGSNLKDPSKIDLHFVRYPAKPSFSMFTPYVQELPFRFYVSFVAH